VDGEGVACVVVRDHDTRPILLLRRAFGRFEGEWCFVAGTPRPDERPEEAATRELQEETGLVAVLRAVATFDATSDSPRIHVFEARVPGTPEITLDSEHTALRWCSVEEARALLPLAAQREALARATAA
jgi:dATP pyrophosphohydrolase